MNAPQEPGHYWQLSVLLPVPLRSSFTYWAGSEVSPPPAVGKRVLVPFGKGKLMTGVVTHALLCEGTPPERLKGIESVLDEVPAVTPAQLALYEWMGSYYFCTPGEALKASLPTGLKLQSELRLHAVEGLALQPDQLADREYMLLEALSMAGELSLKQAGEITGLANARPLVNRLAERGLLHLDQVVEGKYRAKTIRCLALGEALAQHEAELAAALDSLGRAPQQEALLMLVAEAHLQGQTLPEKHFLERIGATSAVAKALVQKGFLQAVDVAVDRLAGQSQGRARGETPTPLQQQALAELEAHAQEDHPKPVLLHGVTGSGKTLLYTARMRQAMAAGKQALYLLPEIALTSQIIERVRGELGPTVGVYHSRFSIPERVEIWQKLLSGEYQAVIGVRSALLLPFTDLGLIIVDEEHDASFKQQEPAPRYHARDAAVWYGRHFNCQVILGSATPSLETYENAQQGKYHLVQLPDRAVQTVLPKLTLIDMRVQTEAKASHGQFSEPLLQALRLRLARNEQAIVFKNRRGFSPLLVCKTCGNVPQCPNCDISLTYHKAANHLRCHYCGYTDDQTHQCGNCHHPTLQPEGIGTERLEEDLQEVLPGARIGRMDLDTTRGKEGFSNLYKKLESGQIQVLVGTQMVTKGLDFENVTLAAVVQADQMLSWPDFRAHENAYQLLVQLAGRTGRTQKAGELLIQTRVPDHRILQLLEAPYEAFFKSELEQRRLHGYPPFSRLIRLELRSGDRELVQQAATTLVAVLQRHLPGLVLGPEFPFVARLRGLYRQQVLVKIPRGNKLQLARDAVQLAMQELRRSASYKSVQLMVDVDPR